MKAILLDVIFSEALFKNHYTRGYRDTYLIPLPTSIAGIYGAMLGYSRDEIKEKIENLYAGGILISYKGIVRETATFVQLESSGRRRIPTRWGVAPTLLLNNPRYALALAGEEIFINELFNKLSKGIEYMPYGGQNDYFPEDFKIKGIYDVEEGDIITNYAPKDFVESFWLDKDGEFQIAPVKHKYSDDPTFYFVYKGKIKLKKMINVVKDYNIGLYRIKDFYYLPIED